MLQSFFDCVMFHLLTLFHHDMAEAMKYYITSMLKKPNRVTVRQVFVCMEQLNSYLKNLPYLYNSPKANSITKWVLPLDDSNIMTHMLQLCPAKWQRQYYHMENSTLVNTRALLEH